MHIGPDYGNPQTLIQAYDDESILVKDTQYFKNTLIFKDTLLSPWTNKKPSELTSADFLPIIEMRPEIILIGTGEEHLFFSSNIEQLLKKHDIGLETMTTGAACRTFNILVSEERSILGLFFMPHFVNSEKF
jgi:uncharacterized protein